MNGGLIVGPSPRRRLAREPLARNPGDALVPPSEWSPALHQLRELARVLVPPPAWWTSAPAFRGGMETQTHGPRFALEAASNQVGDDGDLFYFQLGLAGWAQFQAPGQEPQRLSPGRALFSVPPFGHDYEVVEESPGWTFAWIAVRHPYLGSRVAKQVPLSGRLIEVRPDEPMVASMLRLVRGALRKDFRDSLEAEIALFEFVVAFERWAQRGQDAVSEGQRLMDEVRSLILATLPKAIGVHSLASEFGMSRSHFSHFFREQTGLTPAHFATDVRIQKAARMLLDTRAPLKTVADACGFANANHLCKVFRRLRHLSPSAFRQVCR